MCGRYTYLFTWTQLQRLLSLLHRPPGELTPRYNVAPRQSVPIVRLDDHGQRVGVMLEWGLVPSWSKDPSVDVRPINARGESMFSKPTFRHAARRQRCLVPVSGFYEWQKLDDGKRKQPYWIGRKDRQPFCFAGLWERWQDAAGPGASLETFTIVTTTPNPLLARLHDRMPVIVPEQDWELWLDPDRAQASVESVLQPYAGDDLEAYPVHSSVNNPKRDDATLIERAEPVKMPPGLFDES